MQTQLPLSGRVCSHRQAASTRIQERRNHLIVNGGGRAGHLAPCPALRAIKGGEVLPPDGTAGAAAGFSPMPQARAKRNEQLGKANTSAMTVHPGRGPPHH